jgi:KTSC domain
VHAHFVPSRPYYNSNKGIPARGVNFVSLALTLPLLAEQPALALVPIELDIDSSALDAATYTIATGRLEISFQDGSQHTYSVSLAEAVGLEQAGSQGAYFNAAIRD